MSIADTSGTQNKLRPPDSRTACCGTSATAHGRERVSGDPTSACITTHILLRVWKTGTFRYLRHQIQSSQQNPLWKDRKSVRVGKECVSTCRYRGSPYHKKKK